MQSDWIFLENIALPCYDPFEEIGEKPLPCQGALPSVERTQGHKLWIESHHALAQQRILYAVVQLMPQDDRRTRSEPENGSDPLSRTPRKERHHRMRQGTARQQVDHIRVGQPLHKALSIP